MEKYAKVIVRSNTFHTDNLFTYKIPEFLKNQIYVGHRVLVPFGKGNKPTEAFVFKISDTLEEDIKLKEVVDVLDEEPIFKLEDLELVNWMKNRYLCTYIDCINLIYPKGYKVNNYKVVSLSDEVLNLNENEFTDLLSSLDDIQKDIISKINISKGKLVGGTDLLTDNRYCIDITNLKKPFTLEIPSISIVIPGGINSSDIVELPIPTNQGKIDINKNIMINNEDEMFMKANPHVNIVSIQREGEYYTKDGNRTITFKLPKQNDDKLFIKVLGSEYEIKGPWKIIID